MSGPVAMAVRRTGPAADKPACGCACPATEEQVAPTRMDLSFASVPPVRLRRMAVGPETRGDTIHGPLLDDYRRRHGEPPGGVNESGTQVGPTDAELKYSGRLAMESYAEWLQPTINRRNFARVMFDSRPLMGTPAGLTTQFVNGQRVTNNHEVAAAIPEPPISTATEGGRTTGWFSQPVRVTGNTVMDILSPPPWRVVVPKSEVAAKYSSSTQCRGSGNATVVARATRDDRALEDGVRRGEQEHEDDSRVAFSANIGRYAQAVDGLNGTTPASRVQGADADACRALLRRQADRQLLTQFVIDLNAATARRHANNRHSVSTQGIVISPDCSQVTYTVFPPNL